MADKQDGLPLLLKFFKFAVAFGLEEHVAYRQRLVHNQDLWVDINSHGKSKAHKHAAGIGLYRLIHKIPNIRKVQNILQLLLHLPAGKAHHGSIHVDILNPCIIHIKTSAQLQKSRDHSRHLNLPGRRCQDPGDNL